MYYVSTRDNQVKLTASQAIVRGLSVDGGLLTPGRFPAITADMLHELISMTYTQRAAAVMKLFLDEFSAEELERFAEEAYGGEKFSHEDTAPVRTLDENTHCMELWHGPTCAFKDMALQMLPRLLSASLQKTGEDKTACILVATSGDTGKGALEGFKDVPQTRILVFYPQNGVSRIQQLQMITQEGSNVGVCAVKGNFDDAQSGVKRIFSDKLLREKLAQEGYFLSSANSINWGRVLPQIVYYVSAYCDLVQKGAIKFGEKLNFCVPTGNFGNILAGYYAGKMGVPVGRLICASNSNNVLTDFLTTGIYDRNRTFHQTTSPSMDILISSNLERLLYELSGGNDGEVAGYMAELAEKGHYEVSDAIKEALQRSFAAGWCTDLRAAVQMNRLWKEKQYLVDPHTAVAFHVLDEYRAATGDRTPTVTVSTASPFKFCDSILTALGVSELWDGLGILEQLSSVTGEEIPKPLAGLSGKEIHFTSCTEKEMMTEQVWGLLR